MIPAGAIMLNQSQPQVWNGGLDFQRISSPAIGTALPVFNQLQSDAMIPQTVSLNFAQQSQQPSVVYLRSASSGLSGNIDVNTAGLQTYAIVQPNTASYYLQSQSMPQVIGQQLQPSVQLLTNSAVQQLTPTLQAAGHTIAYIPSYSHAAPKRRASECTSPPAGAGKIAKNSVATSVTEEKKQKLESTSNSSRVLHLKGLPSDVTEYELVQLSIPFGQASQLSINKNNEAFIEMVDSTSAQKAVHFYAQKSPSLRNHVIQVQLSEHDEVDPSQATEEADDGGNINRQTDKIFQSPSDGGRSVLMVTIENVIYPVTVDAIKKIFSPFGHVLRMATLTTNNNNHLLIQFQDKSSAEAAKATLNGQLMYPGGNKLRVEYSTLPTLELQQATTRLNCSSYESQPTVQPVVFETLQQPQTLAIVNSAKFLTQNTAKEFISLGATQLVDAKYLTSFGAPLIAYNNGTATASNRIPVLGTCQQGNMLLSQASLLPVGNVLLVSNLDETKVSPDALFTLFGVYGDVARVKVMFNKKDTALVQFNDPVQAQTALLNLDKLKLWGKVIKVAPSKHTIVQMPKEGQPDAGLTKDYKNSPLHRFKKPNSKNFNNIFPPSPTLHLSNIPSTSKEKLIEIFSEYGTVAGFKFFSNVVSANKDCKMALMQMSSVEDAAHALIGLHNHQLAETTHLRVSFSKSSVVSQQSSTLDQQEMPTAKGQNETETADLATDPEACPSET